MSPHLSHILIYIQNTVKVKFFGVTIQSNLKYGTIILIELVQDWEMENLFKQILSVLLSDY